MIGYAFKYFLKTIRKIIITYVLIYLNYCIPLKIKRDTLINHVKNTTRP